MKKIFNRAISFLANHLDDKSKKRILLDATSQISKRFLTEFNDLESMQRVLESRRYRRAIRPVLIDAPEADNILVYAPHQDDETIGAAGTILRSVSLGKRVKTIYVTNGATSRKQTKQDADVRKEEARKVWDYIGGELPYFWDLPCREIQLTEENAMAMRKQIEESGAGCIFIPFFLEPPLDHRRVNELLLLAHRTRPLPESLQIWAYQVSSMLCPNVVVDITDLIDKKCTVNDIWRSQNVFFNYSHFSRGMAAYNSIYLTNRERRSPVELYAEVFYVADANEYIGILDNYFR